MSRYFVLKLGCSQIAFASTCRQWRREGVCRLGQMSVSLPILGFMTGVTQVGLWGPPLSSFPSGVRGGAPTEIKFGAFLPSSRQLPLLLQLNLAWLQSTQVCCASSCHTTMAPIKLQSSQVVQHRLWRAALISSLAWRAICNIGRCQGDV